MLHWSERGYGVVQLSEHYSSAQELRAEAQSTDFRAQSCRMQGSIRYGLVVQSAVQAAACTQRCRV